MSDAIRCATSQGFLSGSGNTPAGIRDRKEELNAEPTSDTGQRTSSWNLSPLSSRSGEAEVSAEFHCTVSQIFAFGLSAHGYYQEDTHIAAGKRRRCEESSLADDVVDKPSTSPVVPPLMGTTFPSFRETFLSTPSPPMDRPQCADPWRHCSILSLFNQRGFNPFDVQAVHGADGRASSDDRCLTEMQSLRSGVSDLSLCSQRTTEQQRPANYYELPVLNAQEVDDVLE